MPRNPVIYCVHHQLQPLICPICEGAKGGRKTAKLHKHKLSGWGKKGGRPKKKAKAKKRAAKRGGGKQG